MRLGEVSSVKQGNFGHRVFPENWSDSSDEALQAENCTIVIIHDRPPGR